ncbi:hypothetical protein FA04_32900 (plasmid) [Ensifer adhaerens]|nr:hypothetical protein FA04_32900 [Ensifer adhaerens]KDP73008.1 hypothetical protein FA04_14510 [Ensifer adhaerens]
MDLLRFGESDFNSSYLAILRHGRRAWELSEDLFTICENERLPGIESLEAPMFENWFIAERSVPMLVGELRQPKGLSFQHESWGAFECTTPLHLLSVRGKLARSANHWYLLGRPAADATESLNRWDVRADDSTSTPAGKNTSRR